MKIVHGATKAELKSIKKTIFSIDPSGDWKFLIRSQLKVVNQGKDLMTPNIITLLFNPKKKEYGFIRDGKIIPIGEVTLLPLTGVLTPSGDYLYSGYRHDFVEYEGVFVDGGVDYTRCSLPSTLVTLSFDGRGPKFECNEKTFYPNLDTCHVAAFVK